MDGPRREKSGRARLKIVLALGLACLVTGGVFWPTHEQARATRDGDWEEHTTGDKPRDGNAPSTQVLRWSKEMVEFLEKNVTDYSATLVSRERVNGKLGEHERIAIKVRHRPFSVYAYVISPADRKGEEAIYVEGKNNGKLLVHTTGALNKLVGTLSLDPHGKMAMKNKRHAITEIGILNLCREVVRGAEFETQDAESRVQILRNAKVEGRPCDLLEVLHPVRREQFKFHLLRLYVDEKTRIPVRCERYDWPQQASGAAELVEEYTYLDVKLNNGFTDADFDPRNARYAFP